MRYAFLGIGIWMCILSAGLAFKQYDFWLCFLVGAVGILNLWYYDYKVTRFNSSRSIDRNVLYTALGGLMLKANRLMNEIEENKNGL